MAELPEMSSTYYHHAKAVADLIENLMRRNNPGWSRVQMWRTVNGEANMATYDLRSYMSTVDIQLGLSAVPVMSKFLDNYCLNEEPFFTQFFVERGISTGPYTMIEVLEDMYLTVLILTFNEDGMPPIIPKPELQSS